jgi:hypothetical protein
MREFHKDLSGISSFGWNLKKKVAPVLREYLPEFLQAFHQ